MITKRKIIAHSALFLMLLGVISGQVNASLSKQNLVYPLPYGQQSFDVPVSEFHEISDANYEKLSDQKSKILKPIWSRLFELNEHCHEKNKANAYIDRTMDRIKQELKDVIFGGQKSIFYFHQVCLKMPGEKTNIRSHYQILASDVSKHHATLTPPAASPVLIQDALLNNASFMTDSTYRNITLIDYIIYPHDMGTTGENLLLPLSQVWKNLENRLSLIDIVGQPDVNEKNECEQGIFLKEAMGMDKSVDDSGQKIEISTIENSSTLPSVGQFRCILRTFYHEFGSELPKNMQEKSGH